VANVRKLSVCGDAAAWLAFSRERRADLAAALELASLRT
jgi:hypothetical protein